MKVDSSSVKLTEYQNIFYREWLLRPSRSDYNMVLDQTLHGELDIARLNRSLIRLVNDFLLINSNIDRSESGDVFWKHRDLLSSDTSLVCLHDSELGEEDLLKLVILPFDLHHDLLARFHAIKVSNDQYRLVYILHHILIDGLSYDDLLLRGSMYYNDPDYRYEIGLVEQAEKHQEIANQLKCIRKQHNVSIDSFWETRLSEAEGIDLRCLRRSREVSAGAADSTHNTVSELRFFFSDEVLGHVKSLGRSHLLTPYTFGKLVYAILLHRMTGQDYIPVSYPVAITEGKDLIYGAHINSILIGYRFANEATLDVVIEQTLAYYNALKASKAKYLPVDEWLTRSAGAGLLDVCFVQANLRNVKLHYEGIAQVEVSDELFVDLAGKLVFEQELRNNQLAYRVKFDNRILDEHLVGQLVECYQRLFQSILADLLAGNGRASVKDYNLLSEEDTDLQIRRWNDTRIDYPQETSLCELFENQVEKTPDSPAVVYGDIVLSYRELNEKARQLACFLNTNYELYPGQPVALCMGRNENIIVAMLGIWIAGSAYVPIDAAYPTDRIRYILADTMSPVIICTRDTQDLICGISDATCVAIEDISSVRIPGKSKHLSGPDKLAYVMYTSGTTGRPKGVMVEHKSFVNLLCHFRQCYFSGDAVNTVSLTSYSFDIFGLEYGLPLLTGGFVEIKNNHFDNLDCSKYSFLQITPGLLSARLDQITFNNPTLKLFVGGEAVPAALIEQILTKHEVDCLVNVYGPTETTIWSLSQKNVRGGYDDGIGCPIANTTVYILDAGLQIMPKGAIGELYIGGDGVGRGYWNNQSLTNERFISNPFQTPAEKKQSYNGRLYKTGDLVRYMPDGRLEFVGRNDSQVKINGHRIEVDEITNSLIRIDGVREAVVVTRGEADEKTLVAYYVADRQLAAQEVTAYLRAQLPDYMLPAASVQLASLPLTINGKLDKQNLPEPFNAHHESTTPVTDLQGTLCQMVADVLGLAFADVGIDDEFYRLGGNSILMIKLINRINALMKVRLALSDAINGRTVRQLECLLLKENLRKPCAVSPMRSEKVEDQVLSYGQQRLWIIDRHSEGTPAYNIPLIVKIRDGIAVPLLVRALQIVIERHEVLRSFIDESLDGFGYQKVGAGELPVEILQVSLSDDLAELFERDTAHIFDLSSEYPLRVRIYNVGNESYLSLVVHHIAFDGWSIEILLKEIRQIYKSLGKNDPGFVTGDSLLPELPIQYKDYAFWQRYALSEALLEQQSAYWQQKLVDFEPAQLATDQVRPVNFCYGGATERLVVNGLIADKLRGIANRDGVSMHTVLLGSVYLLFSAYSGQDDLVIGSPFANRHYHETEDLIGYFANTLPLRAKIKADQKWSSWMRDISRTVAEAQAAQDVPFERIVKDLAITKDPSRHPVFQNMFVWEDWWQRVQQNDLFEYQDSRYIDGTAKFDLTITLEEHADHIVCRFNYATALFERKTMQGYIRTFEHLLHQISNGPDLVGDISYLNAEDYEKVVYAWNSTTLGEEREGFEGSGHWFYG